MSPWLWLNRVVECFFCGVQADFGMFVKLAIVVCWMMMGDD